MNTQYAPNLSIGGAIDCNGYASSSAFLMYLFLENAICSSNPVFCLTKTLENPHVYSNSQQIITKRVLHFVIADYFILHS